MIALAAIVSPTLPALAADNAPAPVEVAAATLEPGRFVWRDAVATSTEPIRIVISVAEQKAYVYRGEALVAASAVSTGKAGNDTPPGVFTILQKKAMHRSNLYDDAPMPFMQRLTWDGIAIHAGRNPGFPASHGCIRVPAAFAKKLFAATELGTTVEVADGYFEPIEGLEVAAYEEVNE